MEEAPPASPGSEQSTRSGGGGGGNHDGGEHYPHSPGGGGGGGGGDGFGGNGGGGGSAGREQDRFLPVANVTRIMKKGLPANAKIAKDSKEAMQECVSEFISFVTSEASHRCLNEKRKTINGDDLLWAMSNLGFDKYIKPLKLYLKKYRETEGGEGSAKREVGGAQPSTIATGEYQVPQQGSLPHNIKYVTGPPYPYGGF